MFPTSKRCPQIMPRILAIAFAMLAVIPGPCAAETAPPAADVRNNNIHSKQPTPHSNSAAGSSSGEDSAAEDELLASANKSRELAGAPPLRMEESLREAARAHARRMVESERLDHQFSGEPSLLERVAQVSALTGPLNTSLKIDRAGENVAYAPCAPDAHEALMRSPPHRENLLDRGFNVAGVAAIWSKGRLYVVQDFAHEIPSYSAQQSGKLVRRAIDEIRQQAGLPELVQLTPPKLDESACSLAAGLLPTRRAIRRYSRKPRCGCCATRAFTSLPWAPATRAMRRILPGLTGSRFSSTEIIHLPGLLICSQHADRSVRATRAPATRAVC
jgi:uncharacterized protein YkwD